MDSTESAEESVVNIEGKKNGSAHDEIPSEASMDSPLEEEEEEEAADVVRNEYGGPINDDSDDGEFGDFIETPPSVSDPFNGVRATSGDLAVDGDDEAPLQPTKPSETDPTNGAAPVEGVAPENLASDTDANDLDVSFGEFEDAPKPEVVGVETSKIHATGPQLPSEERATQPTVLSFDDGGGAVVAGEVESANGANVEEGASTASRQGAVANGDVSIAAGFSQAPENPEECNTGSEAFVDDGSSAAIATATQDAGFTVERDQSGAVGAAAWADDDSNVEQATAAELETRTDAGPMNVGRKGNENETETVEPDLGGNNEVGESDDAPGLDPSPVAPEREPGEDGNEDDFGEFDTAPAPHPSLDATIGERGDDDDGAFGDFDDAPVLNQPFDAKGSVEMEDDEFGDFDAAPALDPTPDVPVGDEMDEDFGDFDSAPDIADAGHVAAAAADSRPQQQAGAIDSSGALVLRAKLLFSHLFRSEDTVLEESQPGDISALDESPTIADVLKSCFTERQASHAPKVDPSLTSILDDQCSRKCKPPQTIAVDDGRGTYSHFSTLYTNRRTRGMQKRTKTARSRLSVQVGIPEVLDIRLPSPADRPIDMASPVIESRRKVEMAGPEGAVPPPIIDVVKSGGGGAEKPPANADENLQSAQTVQDFLSRIPDLSFMLSSTFSAPRTSSS